MSARRPAIQPGSVFGRLTVQADAARNTHGHQQHVCVCLCGATVTCERGRLLNGTVRSCGCLRRETATASGAAKRTHGMTKSPEYSVWMSMLSRCKPTHRSYAAYGGAGIDVCQEWRDSFEAFFRHVGPRPDGTSIDRLDNTKGYEPGNVRWATVPEQLRNRRVSVLVAIGDEVLTVGAAATRLKVGYSSLRYSVMHGTDFAHRLGVRFIGKGAHL